MIARVLRYSIAALCLIPVFAQADSPITSISFAEGYDLEKVYSHDRDLIIRELALGDSPIGEKLAVAAKYPDKKELVSKLKAYLKNLDSLQERTGFLLVLAHAMILNNPDDSKTPKLVLALAYPVYSNNESLLFLESLVQGQYWLNSDKWDKIYLLVTQYQSLSANLTDDIGPPVTDEFLRYLGLYEKYCEDCDRGVGPSFSCSNVSALSIVEQQICNSVELSRADRVLAEIYNFVRLESGADDVKTEQLLWLNKRAECSDTICIEGEYSGRIKTLADSISIDQVLSYVDATHKTDPQTMMEIQYAEEIKMEIVYDEMDAYLAEALSANPELQDSIRNAHELWKKYADAQCDSIYEKWGGGSVRFYEYYRCQKELAQERTYVIWDSYLTYVDNTPPILPDPR